MIKVKLLRPLDGRAEGEQAEYPKADAERLAAMGVVEIVAKKQASAPANKAKAPPANKRAVTPEKKD